MRSSAKYRLLSGSNLIQRGLEWNPFNNNTLVITIISKQQAGWTLWFIFVHSAQVRVEATQPTVFSWTMGFEGIAACQVELIYAFLHHEWSRQVDWPHQDGGDTLSNTSWWWLICNFKMICSLFWQQNMQRCKVPRFPPISPTINFPSWEMDN